jgi:hypothetical protein
MSEILRVAEVMARIEERVPELAGRLQSAGAFAQVVANGQLPQQTPAGFVLHGGLHGGKAQLAGGISAGSGRNGAGYPLRPRGG